MARKSSSVEAFLIKKSLKIQLFVVSSPQGEDEAGVLRSGAVKNCLNSSVSPNKCGVESWCGEEYKNKIEEKENDNELST